MKIRPVLLSFVFLFLPAIASAGTKTLPPLRMKVAFPDLKFKMPVWLTSPSDSADRLFVVEQKGRILTFKNVPSIRKIHVFLDIRKRVRTQDPEEGLLAMALHPSFSSNGLFYVYYIASNPHREILSEFKVSGKDASKADPSSERVLISIPKKYGNHNGACLLFGADGYLYCGLGDGGAGGDPDNNSQNLGSLWGKMLRIDVDHRDAGLAYCIPKDNPFIGKTGARGEVWAYGLRNPWRMSFDRKTKELWVGDVGQDKWEEVDIIQKGGNYGWSVMEGTHEYEVSRKTEASLIDPVLDYPHNPKQTDPPAAFSGPCITGGYVYRGSRLKGLDGIYLYADYVLGWIRGLRLQNGKVTLDENVVEQPENISSFGEDANGELYLLGYSNGRIYRFEQ